MDTFANYILSKENLAEKIEIVYYLSRKQNIFFDKSVIVKTELVRLFLKYNKFDIDENMLFTACLLCNCKKTEGLKDAEKIKSYAKEGSEYLELLGFNSRFCKICEEVNRYSNSNPRERESDILELVEQFGGMILDRPERIGLETDEALVLLIHKNLKDKDNRYVNVFVEFIKMLDQIDMGEFTEVKALKRLTKMYNETNDLKDFIKKVINSYEPQIDSLINKRYKNLKNQMFKEEVNNSRPLFSEETTRKIIGDIEKQKQVSTN